MLNIYGSSKIFAARRFECALHSGLLDFTDTVDQLCIFNPEIVTEISNSSGGGLFHDFTVIGGLSYFGAK